MATLWRAMSAENEVLAAARAGDESAFDRLVAPYRRELRAHCYRMSGSIQDADDLLQESLLRVWRGLAGFEGRASFRTWIYKVTTHVCLDRLETRAARHLPADLGPPLRDGRGIGTPREDPIWLEPCPADLYAGPSSPEARYSQREGVALAFLTALQVLPPKQRVVLLLRDVVGWEASECAELLETSVASVTSALQRARETLAARGERRPTLPADAATAAVLARYVRAWEHADVDELVALLHEEATLAMPPYAEWLIGAGAIGAAIDVMVFQPAGPGVFRLVPTEASGAPAFTAWRRDPARGELQPMGVHLLEVEGGRIAAMVAFLDPALPPRFTPPPAR